MDYQLQQNSLQSVKKFHRQPATAADLECRSSAYCAICLNDVCGGESYRKLPECGHCFHSDCIGAWLKSHSTCPLCRAQLPQIICLRQNDYSDVFGGVISGIVLAFHNLVEKMCNPLNDELASMLCASSSLR